MNVSGSTPKHAQDRRDLALAAESATVASSRRGFLRQIGASLALGLGMTSLAAGQASASSLMVSCCPDTGCGTDCAAGTRRFKCQCPGFTYCTSCLSRTTCYSGPC